MFTLDLGRSALLRDGQPLVLRRQSFDVLRCLIEARGRVVSTEELVAAVWYVPPAQPQVSVTQCVKNIRRVMGEDARWMIRTVSGTGYEFKPEATLVLSEPEPEVRAAIAGMEGEQQESPVLAATTGTAPAGSAGGQAASLVRRFPRTTIAATVILLACLAIIPFAQLWHRAPAAALTMQATPSVAILALGAPRDQPAMAAALAEEIAVELQMTPRGYDIVIKTAVGLQPRDLSPSATGKLLGSRYVVEGATREEGKTRYVTVRLAEAQSGLQVWAELFEFKTADPASRNLIVARIARQLAVQIRTAESKRPLPPRIEAGHYVIQARALFEGQRGEVVARRVKGIYDLAVAIDPDNVQALQGYSRTRLDLYLNGWCRGGECASFLKESERAIEHALMIDNRSSGAHLLRGVIARAQGNHERSIASFEHVIALNPNYVHGHAELGRSMIEVARFDESIAHIERAFALSPTDPVSSFWAYWAGMAAAHTGDYLASIRWMLRSQQINAEYRRPLPWLAIGYAQTGELARAHETLREYRQYHPGFSIATWNALWPRSNAVANARRTELTNILRSLNVPEGS